MQSAVQPGAFWRRAWQALSYAFDPAREADAADTVFQPREARERAEPRVEINPDDKPSRPPEDILQ